MILYAYISRYLSIIKIYYHILLICATNIIMKSMQTNRLQFHRRGAPERDGFVPPVRGYPDNVTRPKRLG